MAISRDLKINITGKTAKFDKDVFLFQGDRNIDFNIEIIDNEFKYDRFTQGNILRSMEGALNATIKILKPDDTKVTIDNVNIAAGKLVFKVTSDLIDNLSEIGTHYLQILIHADDASKHIPRVQFEVVEPIYSILEQAKVDDSKVNECVTGVENCDYSIRINKGYDPTIWRTGDVISSEKLNKLELKVSEVDEIVLDLASNTEVALDSIDEIFNYEFKGGINPIRGNDIMILPEGTEGDLYDITEKTI